MSQFSPADDKKTLVSLGKFPNDVYPAGRLDYDSEGLLLLTSDGALIHRMLDPRFGHQREYRVEVEGAIDAGALENLRNGVTIRANGKEYRTRPADAKAWEEAPDMPPRDPPVRFRRNIPTRWISLTIGEGKNRQVRHMTAAVGFPTLRLIRWRIGDLTLDGLRPGEWRELSRAEAYRALGPGRHI